MTILSNNDFLEVRLASMIADYDRDTLVNLYQSMIGFEAVAIYMTLWSEANNERISPICTHEQLFLRMRIPPSVFIEGRKHLEAVGLLKTFVSSESDYSIYHYELYAPKSPRGFFDDALLYGTMIKSIGESNANRLKNIYIVDKVQDYGEEITAKYCDVFQPEFNDKAFIEATQCDCKIKGRNSGKINSQFNYEIFFTELAGISQITSTSLKKEEMKEIERLAMLNGVNEEMSARLVNQVYVASNVKGQRVNLATLNKLMQDISDSRFRPFDETPTAKPNLTKGKTDLARKINLMEVKSPKEYLAYLQNGTKPASADMRILDSLSTDYHLPNAVINAIVDYVLIKTDNVLSRAYCEKIAASLVRENCQTAVDAMNYLKKIERRVRNKINRKSKIATPEVEEAETITKPKPKATSNDNWEAEWERILDELKGGNKDGKA